MTETADVGHGNRDLCHGPLAGGVNMEGRYRELTQRPGQTFHKRLPFAAFFSEAGHARSSSLTFTDEGEKNVS
jgi:hypothetical protein